MANKDVELKEGSIVKVGGLVAKVDYIKKMGDDVMVGTIYGEFNIDYCKKLTDND